MTTTHARSIDQTPILNLLTEALNQANAYLVKAEVLRKQVKGATTLLTDILTYENAFVLKVLAEEARIDNVAMVRLSAQAAEDSSAIRIITIITVIFLPATVVSVSLYLLSAPPKLTESMQSFFSTQFVHIEVDSFRLSKSTWIYFAVTAVLTLITIGSWAWLPKFIPRMATYLTETWHRTTKLNRRPRALETKSEDMMSSWQYGSTPSFRPQPMLSRLENRTMRDTGLEIATV